MNKQTADITENKITTLYDRPSRDDELAGDSNSIVNQKKMLEEYAKSNGYNNLYIGFMVKNNLDLSETYQIDGIHSEKNNTAVFQMKDAKVYEPRSKRIKVWIWGYTKKLNVKI